MTQEELLRLAEQKTSAFSFRYGYSNLIDAFILGYQTAKNEADIKELQKLYDELKNN